MRSISLKCLQKIIYRSRICSKYSLIEFLELFCKADRSVYLYQFYLLTITIYCIVITNIYLEFLKEISVLHFLDPEKVDVWTQG